LLLISGGIFAFIVRYAGLQSFWIDELAQLSYIHTDFTWGEIFRARLLDITPPLYTLLIAVWYRIVPYGQVWLLLPSALLVAAGAYFTGLTAVKMAGKRAGVFATALTAMVAFLSTHAGLELRAYALYFLLSATTVYLYLLCYAQKDKRKPRAVVLYGVSLLLLVFTHFFGALLMFGLGLSDLILFARGKIRLRCVVSYLIAGVPFAAWLFFSRMAHIFATGSFWPAVPRWQDTLALLKLLLNGNPVLFGLYCAAVSAAAVRLADRTGGRRDAYVRAVFSLIPILVIGIVFVYSAKLNPRASLFVERYFMGLIPLLGISVALFLDKICVWFSKLSARKTELVFPAVLCFCLLFFGFDSAAMVAQDQSSARYAETYRETAEWLIRQDDIFDESTVVLCSNRVDIVRGWDYYITQDGGRKGFAMLGGDIEWTRRWDGLVFSEDKLAAVSKVYLTHLHNPPEERVTAYLEAYFDEVASVNEVGVSIYRRRG